IETNGLDASKCQALEIAFQIIDLQTNKKMGEYSQVVKITSEQWTNGSPQALQVNGFT
ncbi:3409_t:CDS:1, partial [Ambispora gerdemannii]